MGPSIDERGIILNCRSCGQGNRIPFERLGSQGTCAKCKQPLPAPDYPVTVGSGAEFRALTGRSAVPVLVDFWAEWCGPCKMVAPELVKVAATANGRFLVAKIDTEALPDVAGAFGIRSIPTFVLFQKGREIDRTSGALPAAQLGAFVQRAL